MNREQGSTSACDQSGELGGFGAEGDPRPFDAIHLHADCDGDDGIRRWTRDGFDFARLCVRHQWIGPWGNSRALRGGCPFCAVEIEGQDGRARYRLWHATAAAGR